MNSSFAKGPADPPLVLVEICDHVASITLNRPETLNAIDLQLTDAIADALGGLPDSIRAVVLSGAGRSLCAGAHLGKVSGKGEFPDEIMRAATRAILSIVDCPVPVVCALTGPAAGFGVALALVSDITVMDDDAQLIMAFSEIGLMPDGGLSVVLPLLAGRQRAGRMLMLGERIGAGEALAAGLIAEASSDARARAAAIAADLAGRSPRSVRAIKSALTAVERSALVAGLKRESEGQKKLLTSPEFAEAARAFVARGC